jgi:hypothetical protein
VGGFLSSLHFLNALTPWQWALAGSIPVGIVALYFLKLKRKPLQVPSTWLWKKSIEDLRVNSFWQRLRKNILLLLQLLIAAAALFALGHPAVNAREEGKHWILAIDNSASMSAADGSPSRLDEAKKKAVAFMDSEFGSNDTAMVLSFNDAARVVCSYTNNAQAVKLAIGSIQPSARRTDLGEALSIASGLANPNVSGELGKEIFAEAVAATMILFSDGRFPILPNASLGRLEVQYRSVGTEGKNLGIVRMAARRIQNQPDRVEVFGAVRNFGPEAVSTTAELRVNGNQTDLQNIQVNAGDESSFLFRIQVEESVTINVKLAAADAFKLDNEAWAVVEPPRKVRVLVVGDNNLILRGALTTKEIAQRAEVTFEPKSYADKDLSEDPSAASYDLALFDRCSPKGMPPCNGVFIGATPPGLADATKTDVSGPSILNWNSTHPVMRYLELDDVRISKAFTLPEQKGAEKLLETDRGALILAVPRGVYTDVVQTFPLIDDAGVWQTDWSLKLSFPLYILNLINGLGGFEAESRRVLTPGDVISFRADDKIKETTITSPSGAQRTVKRSKLGAFEFLDTDELGVYEAKVGGAVRRFPVNLFDVDESNIKPEPKVTIGDVSHASAVSSYPTRRELWKWLTAIAFAILLLEWYIYNRRVYV